MLIDNIVLMMLNLGEETVHEDLQIVTYLIPINKNIHVIKNQQMKLNHGILLQIFHRKLIGL